MISYFVAYIGTYSVQGENDKIQIERMAAGNDVIVSPSPIETIEQIRSAEDYLKDLHKLTGCAIMNFKEINE